MEGSDGADWSETERDSYPGGVGQRNNRSDLSNLEELLKAKPAPLPILAILLIVLWLWVPFLVSVVFLAIILGIFGAADYHGRYNIQQPIDHMNQFLSSVMQKREHAAAMAVPTSE